MSLADATANANADTDADADATVTRWWRAHCARSAELKAAGARACLGGAWAHSVGEAFALGYQEALAAALDDALAAGALAAAAVLGATGAPSPFGAAPTLRPLRSLSVTEATGNGPRDLRATLTRHGDGLRLRGEKRFATLATAADELWVAAVDGTAADVSQRAPGRPEIAVVRVMRGGEGLRLTPMPPLGFVPEVSHAFVDLDVELPTSARLPGDGWAGLVKPFGALEDALVRAALASYLAAQGRSQGWPPALLAALEGCAEALAAFDAVSKVERQASVSLEAAMAALDALIPAVDAAFEPSALTDWRRDQRLLQVATRRRKARLLALGPPGAASA